VEQERRPGHGQGGRRRLEHVAHLGLAEAGHERPLGLEGAVLLAELGAEHIDPAVVAGHRLGVLGLDPVALDGRVQPLDRPAAVDLGPGGVADHGHRHLHRPFVQHHPERLVPGVRVQQRPVGHRKQPRGLVGMQVEVDAGQLVVHQQPPRESASREAGLSQGSCMLSAWIACSVRRAEEERAIGR
jgi:hypothetical protein